MNWKDGKGNGPVAFAMKVKVPDLTVLTKMNGGGFSGSADTQDHSVRGDDRVAWVARNAGVGANLHQRSEPGMDRRAVRVENLVKYLESIQVKGKT